MKRLAARLIKFASMCTLASCAAQRAPLAVLPEAPAAISFADQAAPARPEVVFLTSTLTSSSSSAESDAAFIASLSTTKSASTACAAADEGFEDDSGEFPEEHTISSTASGQFPRYTADVSNDELQAKWTSDPSSLGSVALGFVDDGRLVNAVAYPTSEEDAWTLVSPDGAFGTAETVQYVTSAALRVKQLFPEAAPLRINDTSRKEGGWFPPHRGHQNGREVDLGFYFKPTNPPDCKRCGRVFDPILNWELVKSLILLGDVQTILVDRRIQRTLYQTAMELGEDPVWLDSIFRSVQPLLQHAPRHRDHFHVRYYNPRAQELGFRVGSFLPQEPRDRIATVRVRRGDSLSVIAARNGTTVQTIKKANRLRGNFLRAGQILRIPVRGPCTQCPVPGPVEVPPRRIPSSMLNASL